MANHLFLIGIDRYPRFKPPGNNLTTCVKDVTDFKYVLLEKFYFEESNVVELLNEQATSIKIQKQLDKYASSMDEDSNLIIYFSGHGGLRTSSKKGYWIPYDASEDDYTTWISNEIILGVVRDISAKHIFIIADCCFATSLLINAPKKAITDITLDNYKSRWIITSGRQETYCGSIGENSFFGESLVLFLGNCEIDIRVGTLIEFVKQRFNSNILQQPQGHALLDTNHDCGEFIFKIRENKKLFENDIKGYKLFKKVIDIYSKSNTVTEVDNFEDKSNRIGFTLLMENDKVKNEVTYYLYLYNNINQSRTYAYFNDKHKNVLKRNVIIFIPLEEDIVLHERRLNNIQKLFNPKNIFYIDEFIKEISSKALYKNEDDNKYLNINNFIPPEYIVASNRKKIEIEKWLNILNNPILVVKGTAGIGKTTFARYISDVYQHQSRKRHVLFIDSNEIIEELLYLQKSGRKIDLYSFYKASTSNETLLDKDLFSINLDAGNFLLIIDGLDEVISKNISFDIDYFFNSINSSNVGLSNSKIVITTRTFFWDISNIVTDIIYSVELLPFDIKRARNFFEKSFDNADYKIKRALSISEDFKLPSLNNEYYYHPFVLDIIKEIIDSNNQILFNDKAFSSNILNKEIKIDYIIGRICEREIKRVQQIELDKQIKFFIYLAAKEQGSLSDEQGSFSEVDIKAYLKESLDLKEISNNIIESFKSHPFVHYHISNKTLNFRYDFFENYFIGLFISGLLNLRQEFLADFTTVKLLSQKLYYGSDIIEHITKRINDWNDDNLLKISDIIQKIKDFDVEDRTIIKRAISGIFNLALSINIKFKTNSRSYNTRLIKDLFGVSNNVIQDLVLLNVTSLEENIRFDFSNLTFVNSTFENYSQFWDCNLTEATYFRKCVIRNVGVASKEINIPRENFVDCDEDSSLYNAFLNKKRNDDILTNKASIFLENFFKMFYKNGQFKKISDYLLNESPNYPRINKHGVKLDKMVDILVKNGFLELIDDKKHNETKLSISSTSVEIVSKFCFEAKQTSDLINIIEQISKLIK